MILQNGKSASSGDEISRWRKLDEAARQFSVLPSMSISIGIDLCL